MAWLQLMRWQNLLIIFLTQTVVWACLVLPVEPSVLGPFHFLLLTSSTVLIAAAGYIINDYFDVRIDIINHPDRVVLGKIIKRKHAIIAHSVLNVAAILMAGYVAARAQHYQWLLLQLGCTGLLWFYSTTYKRQYLTGNIAVALLTALTIIALYVYEPAMRLSALKPLVANGKPSVSSLPVWILVIYAYFAFMLTWVREIIKDMEDMQGDEAEGCVTMPIKRGLGYATRFATVLVILALVPLIVGGALLVSYGYYLLAFYVLLLLAAPLVGWSVYLWQGVASPVHYGQCSRWLKIIMVLGICSVLIYKIQ